MQVGALQYRKFGNIIFKVPETSSKTITVRVTLESTYPGNYLDKKQLANRAKDLFSRFFPDKVIHARAFPYQPNPVSEIDGEQVRKQNGKPGIRVTDNVDDTGIGKANISGWANGLRPMSQPVKAMFYFYFPLKRLSNGMKS